MFTMADFTSRWSVEATEGKHDGNPCHEALKQLYL